MKKFNKFILLLLSLVFALSFAVFAIPNPDEAPEIYNVRWSRYTARWAVDGYESKFQVSLYRDDRKVITKTTTNKSYNFVSHMSRGDYTYYFEVRAYNEYYGWSSWEQSDYTILLMMTQLHLLYHQLIQGVVADQGNLLNQNTSSISTRWSSICSW